MIRTFMIAAASVTVLTFSAAAFAQEGQLGTAQEARAMLDRAVATVKADRDVALGMFNKGEGGFKDRDLYPFCHRVADGKIIAGPLYVLSGTDVRTLKDSTGKAYGQESCVDGGDTRAFAPAFDGLYPAMTPERWFNGRRLLWSVQAE